MLIDVARLKTLLGRPEVLIIDCRFSLPGPGFDPAAGQRDYRLGHIPGAVYLDLEQHLSGAVDASTGRHPLPKFDKFIATLEAVGASPEKTLIAYDASGNMLAARLWWMLARWLDHTRVFLLDGGFTAWQKEGLPLETGDCYVPSSHYPAIENQAALCDMVDVGAVVSGTCPGLLVDARSPDRFVGKNETVDPVAGHIPGAENLATAQNLNLDKMFLSPEDLNTRFEPIVAKAGASDRVIHYCGSGVTACHNLFAMELAGFKGARLYPGSWSEWIRYPSNLVEKN